MNRQQDVAIDIPAGAAKVWSIGTLHYDRVKLLVLFLLLLTGDLVWALRDRSISPVVQLLFKNHGASDFFNGLMLSSIPSALGLMIGPFVSYHSDRFRSHLGRRIPFLMVTTPMVLLGMLGMAGSKMLAPMLQRIFPVLSSDDCALWILGGAWILFEFGVLVASVVFFALINDVVPHELLGRFFGLFRMVSLLAGIGFGYFFFGYAEYHHEVVFMVLAVAYSIGITLMCCFVKEGEYPPTEKGRSVGENLQIAWKYLKNCSKSPYYWLLWAMLISAGLVWVPSGTFVAFYAKQLDIPMDYFGKLGALGLGISLFLSYPLGILADRFHPLRCVMVVIAIFLVSALLSGFLVTDKRTFSIAVTVQSVAAGAYWTCSASLTMRLFPRSQFAQYGIVGGILAGIVHFVSVPLLGYFLDRTGHCYRYTFFVGAAVALLALLLACCYYRKFNQLGGVKNYQPPEF